MDEQTVKVPRLYQQVAEKLAENIESGDYAVGSRLPSERELTTMFGVSRPTIREAIIALELENLVEVRTGSGVYVLKSKRNNTRFSDLDVGPFELTEARVLFEGEAAALAATMISDEELDILSNILDEMAAENEENRMTHETADKKFHMTIAKATRNSAIVTTIEELWDFRENSLLTRRMYQKIRGLGVKPSVDAHLGIFEALKDHDSKRAREAMRAHLTHVIEGILEATEIEALEAARSKVTKSRERFNLTLSSD